MVRSSQSPHFFMFKTTRQFPLRPGMAWTELQLPRQDRGVPLGCGCLFFVTSGIFKLKFACLWVPFWWFKQNVGHGLNSVSVGHGEFTRRFSISEWDIGILAVGLAHGTSQPPPVPAGRMVWNPCPTKRWILTPWCQSWVGCSASTGFQIMLTYSKQHCQCIPAPKR